MSTGRPLGAVVLAAGLGTRMRSARAKVLHGLGGRPLVLYPLDALATLAQDRVAMVVGHQAHAVQGAAAGALLADLRIVVQPEQRGTGHAVACAAPAFDGFAGDVLILYGDVPRIRADTLRALLDAHRAEEADLTLATICFAVPTGYGRIIRGADGGVTRIVEERDATEAERAVTEINPGLYCVRSEVLFPLLAELRPDNDQGELYLTDLIALAARAGRRVRALRLERADEGACSAGTWAGPRRRCSARGRRRTISLTSATARSGRRPTSVPGRSPATTTGSRSTTRRSGRACRSGATRSSSPRSRSGTTPTSAPGRPSPATSRPARSS